MSWFLVRSEKGIAQMCAHVLNESQRVVGWMDAWLLLARSLARLPSRRRQSSAEREVGEATRPEWSPGSNTAEAVRDANGVNPLSMRD